MYIDPGGELQRPGEGIRLCVSHAWYVGAMDDKLIWPEKGEKSGVTTCEILDNG